MLALVPALPGPAGGVPCLAALPLLSGLCLPGALRTGWCNDVLSHLRWSWVIILSVRMQVEICEHRMAINQVMMALACPPLSALSSCCPVMLLELNPRVWR